ncbi:unnamed protein product [Rotaria sp. Silwood2]|nr:unnamed protein product [Rotaria sp. Silwood2]
MTSETFMTNFLSNRGYFKKYRTNLFGLTGTLGSDASRKVLTKVYDVDLVIIPSSYKKQYISFPDILTNSESEWLETICNRAINESNKDRGTLIICETIARSQQLAAKLRNCRHSSALKLYIMNNMDQEKNVEKIKPGEIIIATNLAGRGTDIKTDDIKKHGGLHVIITFMPSNKRVEEQAFGRTARQGKPGTGQKILNTSHLSNCKDLNTEKITETRDENEKQKLKDFMEGELEVIILKDDLFLKFCNLLKGIRTKIREKADISRKLKQQATVLFKHVHPSVLESNIILSIEERWAHFLRKIDSEGFPINRKKIEQDYEKFQQEIIHDYDQNCVIKNPYYHIIIGNDLVMNDSLLNDNYDKAMTHFDQAIKLDERHSASVYVGKGWLLLKGMRRFMLRKKQDVNYKSTAVIEFNKALVVLSEEMSILATMQILLEQRCPHIQTPLSKQLFQKINILTSYINSLEKAISIIEKSQRFIQITEISQHSTTEAKSNRRGVLKETILHAKFDKENGKLCDIDLISPNEVHRHLASVRERKKIIIVVENENIFKVIFKQKEKNECDSFTITNQHLINDLSSFHHEEITILDRSKHSRVYALIYEAVTSKNGYIQQDFLEPLKSLKDGRTYEVAFNDLTVRKDCGTIDQAIKTIDSAFSKTEPESKNDRVLSLMTLSVPNRVRKNIELSSDYKDISISIMEINAGVLKEFLNPNIEIKQVTKEVALAQLEDNSSFFHCHLLPEFWSPDSCKVNLEMKMNNGRLKEKHDLQIRDVIQIIKQQTEKHVDFNLTFMDANKASKVLNEKVLIYSNQTIEFIQFDKANVQEKLNKIQSQNVVLEITDSKEVLIDVISLLETQYVEISFEEKSNKNIESIKKTVERAKVEETINKINSSLVTIGLIDIKKSIAQGIIDMCPNASFLIRFINVKLESLLNGLDHELVNFHFDKLKKETAKILIEQVRKKNLDFILKFKNLTNHQTQRLIEIAPIEQENIDIIKVKTLSDLFMNESMPQLELSEFSQRGIEYLLQINEKGFIPWRSIAVVVMLAAIQMGVGGALMATGVGGTIGMGLLTEGLVDLTIAGVAAYSRKFSWSNYAKQKTLSLAISAISMGISSIKGASKAAQNIAVGIGSEMSEQAATHTITHTKTIIHGIAKVGHHAGGHVLKSFAIQAASQSLLVTIDGLVSIRE